MTLRTYILALLASTLLGLCAVQQATERTRSSYRLAETLTQEEKLKTELRSLQVAEAKLLTPDNLRQAAEEIGLYTESLSPLLGSGDSNSLVSN